LPILEIAQDFVEEQKEDKPAEEPYIVRAVKASDGNESSIVEIEDSKALTPRAADTSGWMHRRQSKRQCDFVTPCPDGSCCNRKGQCGYGEEVCGSKVCVSNCDATAACGKDSLGGKVKCPLNVCCSAYGYCGVEDDFCRAGNADNSCQKGFGSCTKIEPPSCGGRSAFARSIGYYQFANVRERQCNRITPKQIRTEGFTHLYGAFATIDPDTFAVKPWHEDDVKLYKEFTGLKKKGLETWIAIGGWTFNDPGPTRTTFSDLSASPARRARFIKSLTSFLDEHGFQGVDLDWE
jgi:chitinase